MPPSFDSTIALSFRIMLSPLVTSMRMRGPSTVTAPTMVTLRRPVVLLWVLYVSAANADGAIASMNPAQRRFISTMVSSARFQLGFPAQIEQLRRFTLGATRRLRLPVSLVLLMLTTSAFGSGFALFEHGAKAVAMGGAFAATADDPSAIFYNVAGIAQLRKTEVLFGDTLINFQNSYKGDPNDIFTAGTSGSLYRAHTFSVPNAYVTVPFGSNLTFGVGVFAPFGLRTNWAQPWIGRYVSNDADIKTVSVEPAVAWQTSDGRLAVGVGAEYRRARVILDQTAGPAFNPFTGRFADLADSYLSSDWSSKWGWNVGVLFKPTPMWRLGASYRAPMTIGFTGTATITQIPSGNAQFDALVKAQLPPTQPVNTSIPFPSFLYLAAGTSVIHNWDIEFDAVRNDWNRFKTLQINLETTPQASVTRTENWKSTWSYRLGTNHPVA